MEGLNKLHVREREGGAGEKTSWWFWGTAKPWWLWHPKSSFVTKHDHLKINNFTSLSKATSMSIKGRGTGGGGGGGQGVTRPLLVTHCLKIQKFKIINYEACESVVLSWWKCMATKLAKLSFGNSKRETVKEEKWIPTSSLVLQDIHCRVILITSRCWYTLQLPASSLARTNGTALTFVSAATSSNSRRAVVLFLFLAQSSDRAEVRECFFFVVVLPEWRNCCYWASLTVLCCWEREKFRKWSLV